MIGSDSQIPEVIYICERFAILKTFDGHFHHFLITESVTDTVEKAQEFCGKLISLDHSNILKIKSSQARVEGEITVIRTEYLYSPTNLTVFLNTPEKLPIEEIDRFVLQLLDVLAYMEHKRVHHSNIRPEFIFVSDRTELKLGFFQSSLNNAARDYCGSTSLQSLNNYDAEAAAAGIVIVYLALRKPPYDIMVNRSKEKLATICEQLPVSPRVKRVLGVLLNPEKFAFKFASLKDMFAKGENLAFSLSDVPNCAKCQSSSTLSLNCCHRFCTDCASLLSYCPICASTNHCSSPIEFTTQMQELKRKSQFPSYKPEEMAGFPKTISPKRYPLKNLSQATRETQPFVEALQAVYTSWRKSTNDRNSFYRCIGVAWVEKIFRANCTEEVRNNWILALKNRKVGVTFTNTRVDMEFHTKLACKLEQTCVFPEQIRMNELQKLFQDPEFDVWLCAAVRNATAMAIVANKMSVSYETACCMQPPYSDRAEINNIRDFTCDFQPEICRETPISAVEMGLKLDLSIYQRQDLKLELRTRAKKGNHVGLLYDNEQYFLLYSATQDYLDGYSYHENSCTPVIMANQRIDCQYA